MNLPSSRSVRRAALIVGCYVSLYALLDVASLVLRTGSVVSLWYLSDAASLALLLFFGARYAPAIIVTSLITSFITFPNPGPAVALVAWSVVYPLPFVATTTLLRRKLHVQVPPRGLREVVLLTLGGFALSLVLAGMFALTVLFSGTEVPSVQAMMSQLPATAFHWWIGEAIGLVVVTPLLVLIVVPWFKARMESRGRRKEARPRIGTRAIVEASLQALSVVLVVVVVLGTKAGSGLQLYYLCFLPLIWITLRHGLRGACLAVVLTDVVTVVTARFFGLDSNSIANLQVLMLILALTGLTTGMVVDEQRRSEADSLRRAGQLATAGRLGTALAGILELDEIYDRLCAAILAVLPDSETVSVSLLDRRRSEFRSVRAWNAGGYVDHTQLPAVPLEPPHLCADSGGAGAVGPAALDDPGARPTRAHLAADADDASKGQSPSTLEVPMSAKGEVIGAVTVRSPMPGRYTDADAELLSLVANTAAAAIQNARLLSETQRRLRNIQALHDVHQAIAGSRDLTVTLRTILEHVQAELQVDAASILLADPFDQGLEFAAGIGFRTRNVEGSRLRAGEGRTGSAALERGVISIPDLADATGSLRRTQLVEGEGFASYHSAPLIAKGQVNGVLEIFHRTPLAVDEEWVAFLETLAGQMALAIDDATLFADLQNSKADLVLAYDATIEGWSRAMDLRDKETEGHSARVAGLTVSLARSMGLGEAQLVHVRRGALLHDMGKMGIPDGILLKPGALTDDEWVLMRQHPQLAYDMLEPIAYLRPALDIPLYHHERWDGRGYSHGLKGEQIPLSARLFAVIDVYDALTSNRSYRKAWSEDKALEHIRRGAGAHFDPQAVECFVDMLRGRSPADSG
jgi:HD-GYP domain-containing protein (c-di-GMP phosphodiesterase class II)/integral membrane sensor domain MASE1